MLEKKIKKRKNENERFSDFWKSLLEATNLRVELVEERKDEVIRSTVAPTTQSDLESLFDKRVLKKFPGIQLKSSQVDDEQLGINGFIFFLCLKKPQFNLTLFQGIAQNIYRAKDYCKFQKTTVIDSFILKTEIYSNV